MLALPALPAVLVSHAAAAFTGATVDWLGVPFGWAAWLTSSYVIAVVDVFARLPAASVETGRASPYLAGISCAVLAAAYVLSRRPEWLSRLASSLKPGTHQAPGTGLKWGVAAAAGRGGRGLGCRTGDARREDAGDLRRRGAGRRHPDRHAQRPECARRRRARQGGRGETGGRGASVLGQVCRRRRADPPPRRPRAGLVQVLERYDVEHIVHRDIQHDGAAYDEWRRLVDAGRSRGGRGGAGTAVHLGRRAVRDSLASPGAALRHLVRPEQRLCRAPGNVRCDQLPAAR